MRTFGAPIASILFNCIPLEKSNGAPTEVSAKDLLYIFKKAFSEVADNVITEAEVTLCVQCKTVHGNLHFQCRSIFGNSSSISVDTCSLVAKCLHQDFLFLASLLPISLVELYLTSSFLRNESLPSTPEDKLSVMHHILSIKVTPPKSLKFL